MTRHNLENERTKNAYFDGITGEFKWNDSNDEKVKKMAEIMIKKSGNMIQSKELRSLTYWLCSSLNYLANYLSSCAYYHFLFILFYFILFMSSYLFFLFFTISSF